MELEPGDAVVWHSNLYHFSPPNLSSQSRIAIAGVFSAAAKARNNPLCREYRWCVKNGEIAQAFPPEPLDGYECEARAYPPYPKADALEVNS
jgi:ectoine hydroxylase-related dioxygenase (phytanoyl-CoA dioxygenase family)